MRVYDRHSNFLKSVIVVAVSVIFVDTLFTDNSIDIIDDRAFSKIPLVSSWKLL